MRRALAALCAAAVVAGCASGPEPPPYPAFVHADSLPDQFMATLPGVRAKQLVGDAETRSTSSRIDLPRDWRGTTGGAPGQSLEIFVLAGRLMLADLELAAGGYAYLPAGSLGFNLVSDDGARILYFRSAADARAMIRTPLILDSALVDWQSTDTPGVMRKELRADPGSGARTWLLRIEPGARLSWRSSSVAREGYLVSGEFRHSECVAGQPFTGTYLPGGYFSRPAEAVYGGPEAMALKESIWLLRESRASTTGRNLECGGD